MICESAESASALVGFSATCRLFYACANPQMYEFDAQRKRDAGPNALHWAAFRDDLDMARKALEARTDPNELWVSALPRAEVGHIMDDKKFRGQLDVTPACGDHRWYWTAIHLAVIRGSRATVRLLLNYDAYLGVFSSGFCSCVNPQDVTAGADGLSPAERAEMPGSRPWPLPRDA